MPPTANSITKGPVAKGAGIATDTDDPGKESAFQQAQSAHMLPHGPIPPELQALGCVQVAQIQEWCQQIQSIPPLELATYFHTLQLWEHAARISIPMRILMHGMSSLSVTQGIRAMEHILRAGWIEEIVRTNSVPASFIEFLFQRTFS